MEQRKMGYSRRIYGEIEKLAKRSLIMLIAMFLCAVMLVFLFGREAYDAGKEEYAYFFAIVGIAAVVLTGRDTIKLSNIGTNLSKNQLELNDTGVSGVYTDNPKVAGNEKYISIEYSQIDRVEVKEPNAGEIKFMGAYHNCYIYCKHGLVKFCIDDPHAVCKHIEERKK